MYSHLNCYYRGFTFQFRDIHFMGFQLLIILSKGSALKTICAHFVKLFCFIAICSIDLKKSHLQSINFRITLFFFQSYVFTSIFN